ncbi:MAG: deoxyribodipyrimidine photolyase [Deltaproteobacteria bacterium]|nr:deoxyribodipyrimidine photolyase [Deltaproteobacteria bacterium]
MGQVPRIRIRKANKGDINGQGDFVLYWMITSRRVQWNFSLQRAVEWAKGLKKPLIILEALRSGYPWASDRLHRFVLDGMLDNARALERHNVFYYPYVEKSPEGGKGLLETLAQKACLVVTDDFPAFFIPRMVKAASRRLKVLLEQVDGNGLLPMQAADRVYPTAYVFRRFLQKSLPGCLVERPEPDPLKGVTLKKAKTPETLEKWPAESVDKLGSTAFELSSLPIDHQVAPVKRKGGSREAHRQLSRFLAQGLPNYIEDRNQPEEEGTSGLSPYLHFGHISVHQVFNELIEREEWLFDRLSDRAAGGRSGWWGMSENAESFLDELITWRELGFNMCRQRKDYDQYESLPTWALDTLSAHELDKRDYIYSLKEFERGKTHDPLWNAAQMELAREGRIHNYLRMLWGKKILQWTGTPRKALSIMIELNNKYALDGRDPNSYSGIFWVLGRYDRAWGPERPVFGKVRYMSSKSTARKVRVKNYVQKYGP